ncbi:head GIN domain-containing protein [Paradesertivirga mongoliensis]|uniref:Head GIN domain-containing protein n=1 Tax=Paradesertivirga mongoliensis TaxID=2100740 RepID=A0ABW4ZKQ9_9SPHI|nr:head GIN domain-containing protein [Pedobacter mongoliensis]
MKTIFASFGWLLLLLPFISMAGTKTILRTINSTISSEDRQVSDFTGISSSGSYDIYVKMGASESLRIEGDEDVIGNIETKVDKGILKIRNTKNTGWNWNVRQKVKIYITAKSLNQLSISGSGSMEIDGTIKSSTINTQVSGSGNMRMTVECSTLNAAVSGSGNIRISGSASDANVAVSGSGGFDGKNLKTSTTDARVSGSGNVWVFADERLNAALSGSGNINYSGNARVSQSKSGSGRISKN